MDQVSNDLGDGASLDHFVARFHCGGLPLVLQCDPWPSNFGRSQGYHLNLSFDDDVFYFNKGRLGQGRPESFQVMLHIGHED